MARRRPEVPVLPDPDALLPEPDPESTGEPWTTVETGTPRRPRPVDPALVALFPPGSVVEQETLSAAQRTWREATQREAPSLERLAEKGTVARIDVDLASGYVAVVTNDDTWRAFLPKEQCVLVLALILRRPIRELQGALAKGPTALLPEG